MKITIPERNLEALCGPYDQNIKYLEWCSVCELEAAAMTLPSKAMKPTLHR
jgi:hypothetical protein